MEEKPKKNWKGITSLLCFGVARSMMTGSFVSFEERFVPSFPGNEIEIGISCFGLLCAVSAIRTERIFSKIFGAVAVIPLIDLAYTAFSFSWEEWFPGTL